MTPTPLRARFGIGDRVVYSPTCHGTVVNVHRDGSLLVRLDSGSTITAGADTIHLTFDAWVLRQRARHYGRNPVRYQLFAELARWLGHMEIWETE